MKMMKAPLLLVCLGYLLAGPCFGAWIRMIDGKAYEGTVNVDAQGGMILSRSAGSQVKIELANILSAAFVPAPEQLAMGRGVMLVDGTAIAGTVESSGSEELILRRGDDARKIPLERVARIVWRNPDGRTIGSVPAGKTGVLLANGDFFEGELKGLTRREVTVSSLILGVSRLEIGKQAYLLVLRDIKPVGADYTVRLLDGSVLLARSIRFQGATLRIDTAAAGMVEAAGASLAEIRLGGGRIAALDSLKPVVEPEGGRWAVDAVPSGVPMGLVGSTSARGIGVMTGVTLTFNLEGKYRLFTCRAGVPAAMPPTARVRMIVLVDGKEAFRSADSTSVEDAQNIAVSLVGARSLVLRAETVPGDPPAAVIWGEGTLLKTSGEVGNGGVGKSNSPNH